MLEGGLLHRAHGSVSLLLLDVVDPAEDVLLFLFRLLLAESGNIDAADAQTFPQPRAALRLRSFFAGDVGTERLEVFLMVITNLRQVRVLPEAGDLLRVGIESVVQVVGSQL